MVEKCHVIAVQPSLGFTIVQWFLHRCVSQSWSKWPTFSWCCQSLFCFPHNHKTTIATPYWLQQPTCLPLFSGFPTNISANRNLNGLELCPDATSRHPSFMHNCKTSTNESCIHITFVKQLTYKFFTSYYIFNQTTMAK